MALFAVFKKDFQTENLFEIQRAIAQFTIKESGYPFELKNKSALTGAQCARHDLCKLARLCHVIARVVSCRVVSVGLRFGEVLLSRWSKAKYV